MLRTLRNFCTICLLSPLFHLSQTPTFAQTAGGKPGSKPAAGPQPARLLGVAFAKPSVKAGDRVKIMLRLTRPAPSGGYPVVLESGSDRSLHLPKFVTIPAGASAIGLTVTVSRTARAETLSVKAAEMSEASTRKPQFVTYRTAKLEITHAANDMKPGRIR
jgi:hypothetical protein